jgi:site-specific DNA-methyltransferase (adenine-specific)
MYELPEASVKLMVTSPPYNVTKRYDENLSLSEYLNLLEDVLKEVYRVLAPDGIAALNIANVGRKPYIPLDCYIIQIFLKLNYNVIQEIIWNKAASAGGSCAWGSWQSASNPSLRDVHEYIIIARKSDRNKNSMLLCADNPDFPDKLENKKLDIDINEFFTNIWSFGTESAKKVNHPAPYRVELPYRLIKMFTKKRDLILDPFIGAGTTAIAAIIAQRNYVGYDISKEYVENTIRRIDELYHPEKKIKRLTVEKRLKKLKKQKSALIDFNKEEGK